jgi:DNA-binding GntR family transcriptional regulator
MTISRERLSIDVHQELLRRINRGEYAPGQRLRDSELAEQLGVSRTPVREALLRLEREGFISAQKHLGFSVKPLLESDILEVYPLVRLLECSALEKSPLPSPATITRIRELGRSLDADAADPLLLIEFDSAWHRAVVEGNGNRHLGRVLDDLKMILFRYEYAFMQVGGLVLESLQEHEAILDALEERDRRKAVRLLGAHWERCTEATLEDFRAKRNGAGGAPEGAQAAPRRVPA